MAVLQYLCMRIIQGGLTYERVISIYGKYKIIIDSILKSQGYPIPE
jgi:hypothetical protein